MEKEKEIFKKHSIQPEEDETYGVYTVMSNYYSQYYCIIRKGSDDLGSAIENTLHRLKDAGATDEDIRFVTGMFIPEDRDEYEEENIIDIDLGYILDGPILTYRESEEI